MGAIDGTPDVEDLARSIWADFRVGNEARLPAWDEMLSFNAYKIVFRNYAETRVELDRIKRVRKDGEDAIMDSIGHLRTRLTTLERLYVQRGETGASPENIKIEVTVNGVRHDR